MGEIASLAVAGLVAGSLYALVAIGIALVFRANRVVSFAHPAIGVAAAFTFAELAASGLHPWLALPAAIAVGMVLGVVVDLTNALIPRSQPVSRIMVTVGWLTALNAAVLLVFGQEVTSVPSLFPGGSVSVAGVTVGIDRLCMLGVAVTAGVGLELVVRRTGLGRALRAVSEHPDDAGLAGVNVRLVSLLASATAGAVAALGIVLVARFSLLHPELLTLAATVQALAAAMAGRLVSLPWTLCGALGIGVAQSVLTRWQNAAGVQELKVALPLAVIAAVCLFARTGGMGASPDGDRTEHYLPRIGLPSLAALVVAAPIVPNLVTGYWLSAVTAGLITGIAGLSLVLLTGLLGQISFAQAAFMGVAGYGYAWLAAEAGFGTGLALVAGVVLAVAAALLVGATALRVSGFALAVATFAVQVVLDRTLFLDEEFTGGGVGRQVPVPGFAEPLLESERGLFGLVVACVLVLLVAMRLLPRTPLGRVFRAIREDEEAAALVGVRVRAAKLSGFALAGAVAGLAGVLTALHSGIVVAGQQFNSAVSLNLLVLVAVFGIRSPGGAVWAGLAVSLPPLLLAEWFGSTTEVGRWVPLVSGLILVLNLVQHPYGLAQSVEAAARGLRGRFRNAVPRGREKTSEAS